eukprot:95748-Chlamydomonas_euryale.AAC.2
MTRGSKYGDAHVRPRINCPSDSHFHTHLMYRSTEFLLRVMQLMFHGWARYASACASTALRAAAL